MEGTRRSMSQALRTVELPPEALTVIKAGTPKPQSGQSVFGERSALEMAATKTLVLETDPAAPALEQTDAALVEPAKVAKRLPAKEKMSELPSLGGTVSASFRLPVEIPNALVRASAERKVKRQKPFTQQEIVAEAVTQWLRKNGFLD